MWALAVEWILGCQVWWQKCLYVQNHLADPYALLYRIISSQLGEHV